MQVEINRQMSPFYSCVNPTDISEHLRHWILQYTPNSSCCLPTSLSPLCSRFYMTMPDPCTVGAAWARLPGRSWSSPHCGRGTGWLAHRCRRHGMWPGKWRGGPARRPPPQTGRVAGHCPLHRRRTWSLNPRRTGRRTPGSPLNRRSTALRTKDKRTVKSRKVKGGRKKPCRGSCFLFSRNWCWASSGNWDGVHLTLPLSHKQLHTNLQAHTHTHHVLQRDNMNSCNLSKWSKAGRYEQLHPLQVKESRPRNLLTMRRPHRCLPGGPAPGPIDPCKHAKN